MKLDRNFIKDDSTGLRARASAEGKTMRAADHLMACIPLMAEKGVVVVSPRYSEFMLRLALVFTVYTRRHRERRRCIRRRASVDQVATESVPLAKYKPAVERV